MNRADRTLFDCSNTSWYQPSESRTIQHATDWKDNIIQSDGLSLLNDVNTVQIQIVTLLNIGHDGNCWQLTLSQVISGNQEYFD